MKCEDCGLEVCLLVRCTHCDKLICETCGWEKHEWTEKYETNIRLVHGKHEQHSQKI